MLLEQKCELTTFTDMRNAYTSCGNKFHLTFLMFYKLANKSEVLYYRAVTRGRVSNKKGGVSWERKT